MSGRPSVDRPAKEFESLYDIQDMVYDELTKMRKRVVEKREYCPICWHDHAADACQGEDFSEEDRLALAEHMADKIFKKFIEKRDKDRKELESIAQEVVKKGFIYLKDRTLGTEYQNIIHWLQELKKFLKIKGKK